MRKSIGALLLVVFIVSGIILTSCSPRKPEQINLILKIDASRPASLGDILSAVATRTGMKVESENFDFGGKNGTLKAFLVSDSRTSIMIRGTSDEECHSVEGRRDPSFSRPVYGVSIYRTSLFAPNMPLRQVAQIIGEEAKRHGGALVPESQNCEDTVLESDS